jgi:hypothetical protein
MLLVPFLGHRGATARGANQYVAAGRSWGIAALRKAARNSPARFIQVAAQLIPAHFKVEHEHTIAGLTPEELRAKVLEARAKLLVGVDPDLLGPPPNGRNRKNASIN